MEGGDFVLGGKHAICDCVQPLTRTRTVTFICDFTFTFVFEMIMFSKEGKGGTVTHLGAMLFVDKNRLPDIRVPKNLKQSRL